MSIKLYNAWRFKCTSIKKFNDQVQLIKNKMEPILLERIVKDIMHESIRSFDHNSLFPNKKEETKTIVSLWSEKILNQSNKNTEINATLYFFFKGHYVYFTLMSNYSHSLIGIIEKTPNIEEYGYWDNTDKPDNISSKKWYIRKKTWLDFFTDDQSFDNQFCINVLGINRIPIPNKPLYESFLLPFDKRASNAAVDYLFYIKQSKHDLSAMQLLSWLPSEDGRKEKQNAIIKVLPFLKKDLTYEDLL